MSRDLQVAVIGAGRMGRTRAQAAIRCGANVRYLCDMDEDRATALSQEFPDCSAVTSYLEIDWQDVDAVFICTPPAARGEVELMAISERIPFLVEKPAGLSVVAIQPIVQALRVNPLITAVGYMNRYRRSVQTMRGELALKHILGVSAYWLVGMYSVPWWTTTTGSGGPVNEQATHLVDLARYVVGEIQSVQAVGTNLTSHADLIGSAAINIRFTRGQLGTFFYSCQASTKMIRFEAFAEDQSWTLSDWDFRLAGAEESEEGVLRPRDEIFFTEVEAFLRSVANGDSTGILSSFEDAVRTQQVVDAIHRSFESGEEEIVP